MPPEIAVGPALVIVTLPPLDPFAFAPAEPNAPAAGGEIDEAAPKARGPGECGNGTRDDVAGGSDRYAAGAQGSSCVDGADGDAEAREIHVAAVGVEVPIAEGR